MTPEITYLFDMYYSIAGKDDINMFICIIKKRNYHCGTGFV